MCRRAYDNSRTLKIWSIVSHQELVPSHCTYRCADHVPARNSLFLESMLQAPKLFVSSSISPTLWLRKDFVKNLREYYLNSWKKWRLLVKLSPLALPSLPPMPTLPLSPPNCSGCELCGSASEDPWRSFVRYLLNCWRGRQGGDCGKPMVMSPATLRGEVELCVCVCVCVLCVCVVCVCVCVCACVWRGEGGLDVL